MIDLEDGQKFDLVVVGSGPAGSMCAKTAAENDLDVLLIERELEIGVPDKCGEYLPSLQEMKKLAPNAENLESLFDPPAHCIVNRTKYVNFMFPNGVDFSVPFEGIVVERKLFDKYLANEAGRAGVKILPFTHAINLFDQGVMVKNRGKEFNIKTDIIAGADGAYSLIARKANLPVSKNPYDYAVGYQFEMVGIDHDPNYVEMYLGEDIAPGTYAWIIPKGSDIANVGTGVRTPFMKRGVSVMDYQRELVQRHPIASKKLLNATPTAVKAGNIPVGGPLDRTSTERVMVVGDAGGHTIPTVGGGVPPALIVGRIAGEIAADHKNSGKPLTDYDGEWGRQIGSVLSNSLRLRKMSDIVFQSKNMIDIITRLGWLTRDTLTSFIYCKMDSKMKLIERTLNSNRVQKLLL
jgi:digeranylgeranylglycerophospholipid reductase